MFLKPSDSKQLSSQGIQLFQYCESYLSFFVVFHFDMAENLDVNLPVSMQIFLFSVVVTQVEKRLQILSPHKLPPWTDR